jgi:predicted nucleic acid-binding protein
MILLDASVLIDFDRSKDPKLDGLLLTLPLAACGPTRAEFLHGARNPPHRAKLVNSLNGFAQVQIPETLWDVIGDNLALLRSRGLKVPFPDAVVATVAITFDLELWARDAHFSQVQTHLPALRLFVEPP